MPKKITSVKWTASNIPSGLSFNKSTGTFSGTASNVGEYIVPVTVETNYGTDTQDVAVKVWNLTEYKTNFIYLDKADMISGTESRIDLHEYAKEWGKDEPLCLADSGVNEIEYWFEGFSGEGAEKRIKKVQTIRSGSAVYCGYDETTGELVFSFEGNTTVTGGVTLTALRILSNLGASKWYLRIVYDILSEDRPLIRTGID